MTRRLTPSVNPEAIALENILLAMADIKFGKDMSARIVGGEKRLERLIAEGEIDAVKRNPAQKGKWFCNAADVLRHCRNMRQRENDK